MALAARLRCRRSVLGPNPQRVRRQKSRKRAMPLRCCPYGRLHCEERQAKMKQTSSGSKAAVRGEPTLEAVTRA